MRLQGVSGRGLLWAAGLIPLAANLLLLLASVQWILSLAATALALLPGYLWAEGLLCRACDHERSVMGRAERTAIGVGGGVMGWTLLTLALSALPGGLPFVWTLIAFDGVILVTALWAYRRMAQNTGDKPSRKSARGFPASGKVRSERWTLAGLAAVLLVGGGLRLMNLGYSDFQGDEARAMLRAAEVIQGYPAALMIHKKGPVEILLPTALYALMGSITEAAARLPFALSSIAGLVVIYALGWRMFGPIAGWLAAMLLAVDGYLIGFARIVQYQSVVFLMSALVVLMLYRMVQARQAETRHFLLASLFLATGLLAHYEAIWAAIPAAFLVWLLWRGESPRNLMRATLLPALVGATILAAFFVPFVLDARFARTYDDIVGNRIALGGPRFPYNNLVDFFHRTTIYSSSYYLLLLIGVTVAALAALYRRNLPRVAAWVSIAALVAGLIATFVNDHWLMLGGREHTWLFFLVAVGAAWILPRVSPEERTVWLWFGVPMALSIFFVNKPNSHIYAFFPPWALLVGATLAGGLRWLEARWGAATARRVALPVAAATVLLFANYVYWLFAYTRVEVLRTWAENRPAGYWTPYEQPDSHSLFGFPMRNGWKTLGALYADNTLIAPFDTNETDRVADWYTRGEGYCAPDHEYVAIVEPLLATRREESDEWRARMAASGYAEVGQVYVHDQPRLAIYARGPVTGEPMRFDEEAYGAFFDGTLTSPYFDKNGPVVDWNTRDNSGAVEYRLGEHIHLREVRVVEESVAASGLLQVDLLWETTAPIAREYKVFTQVIDMETLHKAGQRDSTPGCGEYPTDEWRVGEPYLDRYTIRIAPDAPPGEYTLLVGMYDAETHERLPVAGLGDAIPLRTIRVVAP